MPDTFAAALGAKAAHPDAVPIAGGTDLLVSWPEHVERHSGTYIDLSGIDGSRDLRWTGDKLELGALTTYWDVMCDRRTAEELPLLPAAGRTVGAIQIQTRGTWAGNIANASPAADGVPVMMAYDATVILASVDGQREVPLADYYVGYKESVARPDELIERIVIPVRAHEFQEFIKVGSRRAQAITKTGAAIARSAAGWRVVVNSMAPVVKRCRALEDLLEEGATVGRPEDLLEAIRADLSPIDDVRSTARYREAVLSRVLYHALRDHCDGFR